MVMGYYHRGGIRFKSCSKDHLGIHYRPRYSTAADETVSQDPIDPTEQQWVKLPPYVHTQWAGLSAYVLHGGIEIKNNLHEFDWLEGVFERIQRMNHKDLNQLLPSNYQENRLNKNSFFSI